MNFRKYLVLAAIVVFGTIGDICLKHGMTQVGAITAARWTQAIAAVLNPWVALGIVFLLIFFASYLHALSWADLTYVLPAVSIDYILLALLSKLLLHENISLTRWGGILLVTLAVGFVTRGPEVTRHELPKKAPAAEREAVLAITAGSEP